MTKTYSERFHILFGLGLIAAISILNILVQTDWIEILWGLSVFPVISWYVRFGIKWSILAQALIICLIVIIEWDTKELSSTDSKLLLLSLVVQEILTLIVMIQIVRQLKTGILNFKSEAERDSLTGLLNRRMFLNTLEAQALLAVKFGSKFCIMVIDLDHFKNINDTYGHPVGDEVICTVANTIFNALRSSDYVFRIGGEEFVVILGDTNITISYTLAEKIRNLIEQITIPTDCGTVTVTASIGIHVGPELDHNVSDPYDPYKIADRALYRAKALGRNRTVASTPDDNIQFMSHK